MEVKVINIGNRIMNNYILICDNCCVVIDTGYEGGFGEFSKRLSANGISMSDISFIFLTHAHDDHAGFLGELLDRTDAPLILHSKGVGRLMEGRNRFTGGCSSRLAQVFCRLMAVAGKGKHEFPKVEVGNRAVLAEQNTQILKEHGIPARILFLPGHTEDSIALLLDDGRLFCGDAAMNGFPSLARHTIWIEDKESFVHSWDLILESGSKTIWPAHGKPFPIEDLARYRKYLDGKSLLKI